MTSSLARRLLVLVGVACLGILLIGMLGDLGVLERAFSHVGWYVIGLVAAVQLVSYLCDAGFYRAYFSLWRRDVGLWHLYEISLATNFANVSIPLGGAAGTAVLAKSLQQSQHEIAVANSTLAQVCKYLFTYASFLVILSGGLVCLALYRGLGTGSLVFALLVMGLTLAGGIACAYVASKRRRLLAVLEPIIRTVNFLGARLFKREELIDEPKLENFLSEFYRDLKWVLAHRRQWPPLVWWAFGRNAAEIATLYVVFISFGQWVNPGVIVTGYTLAIIAGTVALPISGMGAYEAGMVGAFVALGMPFGVAFAVVAVYRTLNLGIFLPISFIFYRKYIHRITGLQPVATPAST